MIINCKSDIKNDGWYQGELYPTMDQCIEFCRAWTLGGGCKSIVYRPADGLCFYYTKNNSPEAMVPKKDPDYVAAFMVESAPTVCT
jgi:hypothetical protein